MPERQIIREIVAFVAVCVLFGGARAGLTSSQHPDGLYPNRSLPAPLTEEGLLVVELPGEMYRQQLFMDIL